MGGKLGAGLAVGQHFVGAALAAMACAAGLIQADIVEHLTQPIAVIRPALQAVTAPIAQRIGISLQYA